jgi:hypothetical protein
MFSKINLFSGRVDRDLIIPGLMRDALARFVVWPGF